uniref:Uncharacterized protein n=1 Tax=Setaria italica TaxID=4555 RepID=K3Z1B2_SETIT
MLSLYYVRLISFFFGNIWTLSRLIRHGVMYKFRYLIVKLIS